MTPSPVRRAAEQQEVMARLDAEKGRTMTTDLHMLASHLKDRWGYSMGDMPDELVPVFALQTLQMANKRIAALELALTPFAHDDLCKELGGNVEGEKSIIFQRGNAVLRLADTLAARAALEPTA